MGERDDVFQRPKLWSPDVYGDRCFYYDAFISHSRGDESHELADALRCHGLRIWYDAQQNMDDARWSTRIIWGLQASRSVICFVGSKSLDEHDWVRTEVSAARTAAEAAGVKRIFVVQAASEQEVPSWLSGDPIELRYESGNLSKAVQSLAVRLRNMNRVTIETQSPPFEALMQRARKVRDYSNIDRLRTWEETLRWLDEQKRAFAERWRMMNDLEKLRDSVDTALSRIGAADSAQRVNHVGSDLYIIAMTSSALWPPPKQPVDGADSTDAQRLADDLGLLASLPNVSIDYRGSAYVALERLAQAGVVHAFDVLRACMRWEWSSALVKSVAETLARYPEHRDRDEAVLTILKTDSYNDPWTLDLLGDDDGAVRLRHHARRLTAAEFRALSPPKRRQELAGQMEQAIQSVNETVAEVVIWEAIRDSGIAHSESNYFRMDDTASSGATTILPALISQCSRDWPSEHYPRLWRLPFETYVFGPLHALHHVHGERCGASEAMAAFIAALEAPVSEHEQLLADVPEVARTLPVVALALHELESRRYTIDALRDEPKVTQDGDWLDIVIFPGGIAQKLIEFGHERYRLLTVIEMRTAVPESEELQKVQDVASRVVDTWVGIPIC